MAANSDGVGVMAGSGPVSIGLIGANWRAQYYLRIAQQLPENFTVRQVLTRTEPSATQVEAHWGVAATTDAATFLRQGPYDYVVVATPRAVAPQLILWLVAAGIPVLTETPPADDLPSLVDLYGKIGNAPVQVAEQYQFQPQHAARLAVARSGLLDTVTSARMSIAHGYHGVSMLRLSLGAGFEPVAITAQAMTERLLSARGRDDWNAEFVETDARRTTALLRFGEGQDERFGHLDFSDEQYFSPIRSRHIGIQGSQGEIDDDRVSYLTVPGRAVHENLYRETTGLDGDLEGSFLRRVWLGRQVYYENRFVPARLNDDELAVAEVMQRMAEFSRTGVEFYGLADASHDHYLGLLIDEAARTGHVVRSAAMPWASVGSVASDRATGRGVAAERD
jgi:predicted dehydrogenase